MSLRTKQIGLSLLTFAIYTLIFNWQVAAVLCIGIGFHEYSHLWAAKKIGIPTYGFFLIPFMGGLALVNENGKTRSEQAFLYIMGPVGGGLLAFVCVGLFILTGIPLFGIASLWMIFINLFNLLPLSFLDGGRLMDSIMYSINRTLGFVCQIISTTFALWFLWKFNPILTLIVGLFGVPSLIREGKNWYYLKAGKDWLVSEDYLYPPKKQSPMEIVATIMAWGGTAITLYFLKVFMENNYHLSMLDLFLR